MAKIIPITEHFQHCLAEMKQSFWGDLYGQTRQAWQRFFELQSERQRDRFSGWGRYERRRGGKGASTATATMSGVSWPGWGRFGCALRVRASRAFCRWDCGVFSAGRSITIWL